MREIVKYEEGGEEGLDESATTSESRMAVDEWEEYTDRNKEEEINKWRSVKKFVRVKIKKESKIVPRREKVRRLRARAGSVLLKIISSSLKEVELRMGGIEKYDVYGDNYVEEGYGEEDGWEDVDEDLEWGIRERGSDDGGTIGWWMECWRRELCRDHPPMFFVVEEYEVKWFSRGFWWLIENNGIDILVNGWSGVDVIQRREKGDWDGSEEEEGEWEWEEEEEKNKSGDGGTLRGLLKESWGNNVSTSESEDDEEIKCAEDGEREEEYRRKAEAKWEQLEREEEKRRKAEERDDEVEGEDEEWWEEEDKNGVMNEGNEEWMDHDNGYKYNGVIWDNNGSDSDNGERRIDDDINYNNYNNIGVVGFEEEEDGWWEGGCRYYYGNGNYNKMGKRDGRKDSRIWAREFIPKKLREEMERLAMEDEIMEIEEAILM
jgi:hypothetical protein